MDISFTNTKTYFDYIDINEVFTDENRCFIYYKLPSSCKLETGSEFNSFCLDDGHLAFFESGERVIRLTAELMIN